MEMCSTGSYNLALNELLDYVWNNSELQVLFKTYNIIHKSSTSFIAYPKNLTQSLQWQLLPLE
jgi:hypothetical protein